MRLSANALRIKTRKSGGVPIYFAGLDLGSTMTKVVILDEEIRARVVRHTGAEHRRLANRVMEEAL